jgi:hypothetical protein
VALSPSQKARLLRPTPIDNPNGQPNIKYIFGMYCSDIYISSMGHERGYLNMSFLSSEPIQFNVSREERENGPGLVVWKEKIVFH